MNIYRFVGYSRYYENEFGVIWPQPLVMFKRSYICQTNNVSKTLAEVAAGVTTVCLLQSNEQLFFCLFVLSCCDLIGLLPNLFAEKDSVTSAALHTPGQSVTAGGCLGTCSAAKGSALHLSLIPSDSHPLLSERTSH